MTFIKDSSVFTSKDLKEFRNFLEEREDETIWHTDDDDIRINKVRFTPVIDEPIIVAAKVAGLKATSFPKFTASEDTYLDTMYSPDYGYEGSTQLALIGGKIIPVGDSAIRGIIERAGIRNDGWMKLKRYSPLELSSVLNSFMKASKGSLCVLEQDEKIRAFNSGKYAICPADYVFKETEEWIKNENPQAEFKEGIYTHDYCLWTVALDAYTQQLFSSVPELIQSGFKPALIVQMSNNGTSAINLRPALSSGNTVFPLANDISCAHIAKGNSIERTERIKEKVKENFSMVFPSIERAAEEVEALKSIDVSNARNALARGLKSIGMPMAQSLEAIAQFEVLYPDTATAFDCYLSAVDAYFFTIRDFENSNTKKLEAAESISRAVHMNWAALGQIPGTFSW